MFLVWHCIQGWSYETRYPTAPRGLFLRTQLQHITSYLIFVGLTAAQDCGCLLHWLGLSFNTKPLLNYYWSPQSFLIKFLSLNWINRNSDPNSFSHCYCVAVTLNIITHVNVLIMCLWKMKCVWSLKREQCLCSRCGESMGTLPYGGVYMCVCVHAFNNKTDICAYVWECSHMGHMTCTHCTPCIPHDNTSQQHPSGTF